LLAAALAFEPARTVAQPLTVFRHSLDVLGFDGPGPGAFRNSMAESRPRDVEERPADRMPLDRTPTNRTPVPRRPLRAGALRIIDIAAAARRDAAFPVPTEMDGTSLF
jgi:hypothetical protein